MATMVVGPGAQSFTTHGSGNWQARGACTTIPDPSIMFPDKGAASARVQEAKRVCAGCPVERRCLEYAVVTNQHAGVWGRTTEQERRWLRREWRASGEVPPRTAIPPRARTRRTPR